MNQKTDVLEFVRIVDLGDAGPGDDAQARVRHHRGGMLADLGRRIDVQKTRVGAIFKDKDYPGYFGRFCRGSALLMV
ncbi:MAG: hypothetical protein WCD88_02340 [Desulfobacterales bacterium]